MSDQPNPSFGEPGTVSTSAPTSVWEDFIDILHSPSAVFARRENGGFWLPMLVVTLTIAIIFFAIKGMLQPMMDAEFQRASAAMLRKNPQLTDEQLASMRNLQEKISGFALIVFIPLGIFLTGIVLWLAGKLFDARETLRTAIVVAAYAFVPKIIEIVLTAVQALILDSSSLTSHYAVTLGLGRFLNPDTTSPILLALLGRVDVFTIWVTVLLAIGLSVTGRIPRSRAAMAAALVWLVGALPGVLGALRS